MMEASILRAMLAAGATAEMIVVAVEAAIEADRTKWRERKMSQRQAACPKDTPSPSPPMINNSTPPTPTPDLPSVNPSKSAMISPESPLFLQFWEAFPRKVAKGAALKAFRNALRRSPAEPIIEGARRYAATKPDPQYTKHPATWLNADCWLDEPEKKLGTVLNGPWKPIERESEGPKISEEERQRNLAKLRGALKQSIDLEKPGKC